MDLDTLQIPRKYAKYPNPLNAVRYFGERNCKHHVPDNPGYTMRKVNRNLQSKPTFTEKKLVHVVPIPSSFISFQLYNTSRREMRAKATLESVLQKIKSLEKINEEQNVLLEQFEDIPLHLFKKPHHEYTEAQKQFATTLHFYSSKAYDFLRESLPLPHRRTLQK